jgi:hypothetical protein
LLNEDLGNLKGFPDPWIKEIIRRVGGENSEVVPYGKALNSQNISKAFKEDKVIAIVAKDAAENPAFMVVRNYDGYNVFLGAKESPETKEVSGSRVDQRGGYRGGKYHPEVRRNWKNNIPGLNLQDIPNYLPAGDFKVWLVKSDVNRETLQAKRAKLAKEPGEANGITRSVVRNKLVLVSSDTLKRELQDLADDVVKAASSMTDENYYEKAKEVDQASRELSLTVGAWSSYYSLVNSALYKLFAGSSKDSIKPSDIEKSWHREGIVGARQVKYLIEFVAGREKRTYLSKEIVDALRRSLDAIEQQVREEEKAKKAVS